jgi:hypothetical protein
MAVKLVQYALRGLMCKAHAAQGETIRNLTGTAISHYLVVSHWQRLEKTFLFAAN